MAKYLTNENGAIKEVSGISASAGAGDANKILQLGSDGKLDPSVLPSGVGQQARSYAAFENISAGDFVNIFSDAGTPKIRRADATAVNKRAHGYVTANVTANQTATVFFDDINPSLTGLTIGGDLFLSDTNAGKAAAAPPTGANKITQKLGYALSTTEAQVTIEQPIILA